MREKMIEMILECVKCKRSDAERLVDVLIRRGVYMPVRCKNCVSYIPESGMCLIRYKHKGVVRSEKVSPNFYCADGKFKYEKDS